MKIGKLAELSGLTASRIRFYEATGVIKAVERTANGYRDYPPEALSMLEIIASAQRAGFSLEQIRHLLPTGQGSWQHESLVEALKHKVTEIEEMQERLNQNRAQLLVAIESIENRPANLNCSDRKEWVMGRLRDNGGVPERKKGSR
ncbi:MerR family transcriptional regulator [Paraburkholderia phenazinium]|jgi:DNA-binding transcriptional MerR regulator|uniref:DNA-binding transcriptional regulator, MerR family n=1 Tax=Paraburkholderia phenazinium TaxID=60549 RepID=A0A1G7ZGQ1_9BURK|nr:MerR family transcriptional regulator [Paraburkholderia phenazinium]SDH07280.1 DNA-binding transcriptional regulator, MerR family [Paraburkholderia phenazinium]